MEYHEYIKKWVNLFNQLPKCGEEDICFAYSMTFPPERDCGEEDVEIIVEFSPNPDFLENRCKLVAYLKEENMAIFELGSFVQNYDEFSSLLDFTGTWKEIFFVILKMLQEGWPDLKFSEDHQLLLAEL